MLQEILDIIFETKLSEVFFINQIFDFKDKFCYTLFEEKEKLPYNINLLDIVHPNENDHSRIFVKLIQYKENGTYILLQSFMSFLGKPFSELYFHNPIITAERDRIDIRIRGKNKTLIIENKIHGARDRYRQIKRYINIERNKYSHQNIHVLYLTKEGGSPSESSLPKEERESLCVRYREINYKDDILHWLKSLLPANDQIRKANNSDILESAILQYANHLEGMFDQRKGEDKMKNAIKELVKEKMNMEKVNGLSNKLELISDYREYISELDYYLSVLDGEVKDLAYSSLNRIAKQLSINNFDDIMDIKKDKPGSFGKMDSSILFIPKIWNNKFAIGFGFDHDLKNFFYGIRSLDDNASDELQKELNYICSNLDLDESTKYWPCTISLDINIDELIEELNNVNFIKGKIVLILKNTENVEELMKKS